MGKLKRELRKLLPAERKKVFRALQLIIAGDTQGLDIKKLRGSTDIYRARTGELRIIYRHGNDDEVVFLSVGRRSEKTYKDF